MSNDQNNDQPNDGRSERPRSEPEIIAPGRDEHPPHGPVGIWMRVDEHEGVHHIVFTPPGPGAIVFGLLLLSLLAAAAFLALAGFFLLWVPIVLGGILLALGAAAVRRRWYRLRARWTR